MISQTTVTVNKGQSFKPGSTVIPNLKEISEQMSDAGHCYSILYTIIKVGSTPLTPDRTRLNMRFMRFRSHNNIFNSFTIDVKF